MENLAQKQTYSYSKLARVYGISLPTPKTEEWRYTRLRELDTDDYLPAPATTSKGGNVPFDCDVINICNGFVSSELPQIEGVMIRKISEAGDLVGKNADKSKHPFAAMNEHLLENGLFIEIKKNLSRPILINYHMVPEDKNYFYHYRNVIVCHDEIKAEIIEQFTYEGELKSRYLANLVNEIFIGCQAELKHYKYQNEAFKANHIALQSVSIEQDGKYESFCLQKGADIARNETEVALNGTGAEAVVNAAYRMNGWAKIDTTTNINHNCAHTKSSQLVKGVIGDEAKGIFQGRIHIAPNAVGTTGTQLHKAVLLSDMAEIDVKPELEIFADDVKCSHGAASGELDKEQLFYMQARGIGEEEAKQLLIDAYLKDAVSQITDETIQEWFNSLI